MKQSNFRLGKAVMALAFILAGAWTVAMAQILEPVKWEFSVHETESKSELDVVFHATIVGDVDPSSITIRTPELVAVGWFSPDDLPQTDREAGDVISLITQVRAGGSCVLIR